MDRLRRGRRSWPAAASALLVALALGACSPAAAPQAVPGASSAEDADRRAAALDEQGADGEPRFAAQIAERQIIKTGELTIRVEEVGATIGRVRALATQLDGYVSGTRSAGDDEYATLTLRVPAEAFDVALDRLRELAVEVVAEATQEEDVTTTVIDLEARIENLEASEAQYRALIDRATTVEDILAVQRRLDEVRGEIEQLSAQLEHLTRQATLSTLTVTLVPPDRPVDAVTMRFDPGSTFDEALAALVGIGQTLVNAVIWFAVVWLPVLLVVGVLALVGSRVFFAVRRRLPSPQEPPLA